MDPRRVLTFRAVAHERSFSAAARALSLTQPAVLTVRISLAASGVFLPRCTSISVNTASYSGP